MSQKKIRLREGLSREATDAIAEQTRVSGGAPHIGDHMPDGTIYAGISPDTSEPMYTTPASAPQAMGFPDAQAYASRLEAHGHKDWRLPSKAELQFLFDHHADIGGFDLILNNSSYWSCTSYNATAYWCHRFADNHIWASIFFNTLSVRCVR